MENPEYQAELGIDLYPPYTGALDKRWRHPSYFLIEPTDRLFLEEKIFEIVNLFPEDLRAALTDIQIVGSFAYGVAHDGSDFDIVLVVNNSLVEKFRNLYIGKAKWSYSLAAIAKNFEVQQQLGCVFDISIGPDARSLICYSLFDKRFYGKLPEETKTTRVRYDEALKQYKLTPFKPHTFGARKK